MIAIIAIFLSHDQAVHHSFHCVDFIAVHLDVLIQLVDLVVHAYTHKARLADLFQHSLVGAFTPPHQWS